MNVRGTGCFDDWNCLRHSATSSPGSTIVGAYVQFQADEASADPASLTIRGEAADNAAPFTATTGNLSARATTSASVSWSPGAWTLAGEIGPAQRTPGLEGILQQIVSRPGWAGRNALGIIISGSGRRVARAFEGSPAGAAGEARLTRVGPDGRKETTPLDMASAYATLAGRGVTFITPPHRVTADLWLADFQDSEGNVLVLMSEVPAPRP